MSSSTGTEHKYYAIYSISRHGEQARRGAKWDLHATAVDRDRAVAHARMLEELPHIRRVRVKRVSENAVTGEFSVKAVRFGMQAHAVHALGGVLLVAIFMAVPALLRLLG